MNLIVLALGSLIAQAEPQPLIYACAWGDQIARLNLSAHKVQVAGIETELNEGLMFNFRTTSGPVVLDLGDPDVMHFKRPQRIDGSAEHDGKTSKVTCSLAD